ncbi:fatty acid desaturase family protein [Taibaiella koreensis]|uniref:fatty acid desaturase family protein n=1 Tax=Taibaiella koreensis TaxID=1268548 RepID=UPI000E59E3ED|nr:acyl-CoA desaturase [Taibaiella koreensis]
MSFVREKDILLLPQIRYTGKEDLFYQRCRNKVNRYFIDKKKHKLADSRMHGKTLLLFSLWILLYMLMLCSGIRGWSLILLQIAWHFNMFLMSVGIAHDGTHHAYSNKRWVNKFFTGVFDYIGINSDMWEYNHIHSHHRAPNVPVYDSAIFSLSLFRFHPRAPYYRFHRYQHRYIFIVYAFSTLFKLFILDFFSFSRSRIGFISIQRRPITQFLYLLFTKAVVITYTLVLPLILIDAPAWQIVTGFLLGHMISGIALGIIFQVTHLHRDTTWPEPDATGNIKTSFAQHILLTTADFCPSSRVITWISGGLNIHVAHHLFPRISQMHRVPLARIIKETAAECGLSYHYYPTILKAIRAHLDTLKMLGREQTAC